MIHQLENTQDKFNCAACGEDFDRETAVAECRECHRTFCDECVDDQGICVSCETETTRDVRPTLVNKAPAEEEHDDSPQWIKKVRRLKDKLLKDWP